MFEVAIAAVNNGLCDGIGFALGEAGDVNFAGVDLDNCRDPETGELSDLATEIVSKLDTYCEVSPTGTGVKLLLIGRLPDGSGTKNDAGTVEVYPRTGRYFTVTTQRINEKDVENREEQLLEIWDRYIGSEKAAKPTGGPLSTFHSSLGVDEAVQDMLTLLPRKEENDGSRRLFALACRAKEHDLSIESAINAIRIYEAKHPFPKAYTDEEIRQRIEDAEKRIDVVRGSSVTITNYRIVEITDSKGKPKDVAVPLSMAEIMGSIRERTDNWPRRIDKSLFVLGETGIDHFDRSGTSRLFGWLRGRFNVNWHEGGNFVGQSELFAELERTAQRYESIELLPHEPAIENIYYRYPTPSAGDGKHLAWLLDQFRPETPIDRDLIKAAMMTVFWGGPPGARPVFTITSDDGRGVGKSVLVQAIGYVCGGELLEAGSNDDLGKVKTRLLTTSARTKRIALLDNVKSQKLSWADFEALVTSPVISGHQLYVGDGQRPNLLTWFITVNGACMASDMAQRSVVIKLVRGENDGLWWEQVQQYIDQYRELIIGDLIAALRAEPTPLTQFTRWATWERHVISRLSNPDEIVKFILERQSEVNGDLEEAELIESYFADQLRCYDYEPSAVQLRIPSKLASEWFIEATGCGGMKNQTAATRLTQMANEGQLRRIKRDPCKTYGRCFIWTGEAADVTRDHVINDLVIAYKKNLLRIAPLTLGAAGA